MNIKEVVNYYSDLNTIYIPQPISNPIEHILTVNDSNITTVKLCNSEKGFTSKVDYVVLDSNTIKIAVSYNDSQGEDITSVATDKETLLVRSKFLKKTNKVFKDYSKTVTHIDSNLMSIRSKAAMPAWSTAFKNNYSVTTKLTSVFHNVFSECYTKISNLRNNSNYLFSNVNVNHKPDLIVRDDGKTLKETLNMYSSFKEMKKVSGFQESFINKFVLKPTYDLVHLDEINTVLPTILYITGSDYTEVVIKGLDKEGEGLTETLYLYPDMYIKINSIFSYITDISFDVGFIYIADHIDFKDTHYIIDNTTIVPPIVNEDSALFHPYLMIDGNNILISDPTNKYKYETVYKFVSGDIITSAYLTPDLDLIYTTKDNLIYSKLSRNLESGLFDSTVNNNAYISMSDTNANKDEWVDINVNVKDWVKFSKDDSFLIQLRNQDKIFYFDVINNTISNTPVFLYKTNLKDTITFSINIENNSPYTATILSSDLKLKSSACSIYDSITPYKTIPISTGQTLYLVDDEVILSSSMISDPVVNTLGEEGDDVIITFSKNAEYIIEVSGYIVTNKGDSTLPEDYYTFIDTNIVELVSDKIFKLGQVTFLVKQDINSSSVVYVNNERLDVTYNDKYVIGRQ